MGPPPPLVLRALAVAAVAMTGCSLRAVATSALADTFAASGSGYGSDEDPDLVREAVPFALKTMEQILPEQPRHRGLHVALARGFTQYAYAFVQQEADRVMDIDVAKGKEIEARSRRLLLRGRDYGLRGLELLQPGIRALLLGGSDGDRKAALARLERDAVPLLYWTGAAWGLAIAAGKDQMSLVGDLAAVEALQRRALELDEAWGEGAIHEFFIPFDAARSEAEGGGPKQAKAHLERAQALSQNKHLGAVVSYAEAVCVAAQDKAEFTRLLEGVVTFDVHRFPEERLANVVAQRRARWLLGRTNDLFAQ